MTTRRPWLWVRLAAGEKSGTEAVAATAGPNGKVGLMVFPRLSESAVDQALALARTRSIGVLLTTSWFMAMVVVVATIMLPVETIVVEPPCA